MNDRKKLLLTQLGLVLGICYFFFFFGLGAFGLVGADEPRYAQIAREMLARHDWIVPTLNGQPWLEKPVLLYWQMMNSYALLGVHDWAARIPAAAHAAALVIAVFFFMRRFRFASELDAAVITASSAAAIGFGRAASTDMLLSAPFAMAMMSWWTWRHTGKKLWLLVFYALLGAGALAKGPVAPALALLIVGAYAGMHRDGKILRRSISLPGLAVFFLIALPWFLLVQRQVPQFFRTFFIEHNLERFGTNLYQHSQPFWYYVPVFLLAMLPWTVFAVPALVDAGRQVVAGLRKSAPSPESPAPDGLSAFLFLWTVLPVLFFSISRSKLPGYILPAIPGAALLTADYLHRSRAIKRLQLALHALVCATLLVAALMAPFALLKMQPPAAMGLGMAVTGGVIAFMVLLMVRREGVRVLHFVTLVPTILAVAFLLRPAAPVIDRVSSARSVQARLVELGQGSGALAVFRVKRDLAYGLNFYRNQPISYYETDGPYDLPPKTPSRPPIPREKHVLVARQGSYGDIRLLLGGRALASIGELPSQHVEFFVVGPKNDGQ